MLKRTTIRIISFYQRIFSPDSGLIRYSGILKGENCGFYPSCSEYSKEAVEKYGVFKGLLLSLRRIIRCHPWQKERFDPLI